MPASLTESPTKSTSPKKLAQTGQKIMAYPNPVHS